MIKIISIPIICIAALLLHGCAPPTVHLADGTTVRLEEGVAEHLLCQSGREGGSGLMAGLGLNCGPDDTPASAACAVLVNQASWDAYKRFYRAKYTGDTSIAPADATGKPRWPDHCP